MHLKSVYVILTVIANATSQVVQVKVKQGTLIGIRSSTAFQKKFYYAFYGVPYAQPPTGPLRFKDPKPLKKWKKPYDASIEYHGACAQAHIVHKHGLYGVEDCLNMNIYTPRLANSQNEGLKPVIVWVHGYAFTSSFSHIHGADFLLDNDVLFVSVTHRIGVFGFLKMNETDTNGNMGLKDIIRALRWIRTNIRVFGGDSDKMTVMGSGSAATYLSLLLTTKYKKLFSKIILHSGAFLSPSLFQTDFNLEKDRFIKNLKKLTLDDLSTAKTWDIIKASREIYNSKEMTNFQRAIVPFTPIIEKPSNVSIFTKNPLENVKKHGIPILIGFNSQESISEAIPFLHNPRYLTSFEAFFKFMVPFTGKCQYAYTSAKYKEISNKIKRKYFEGPITEHSLHYFLRYVSDILVYPVLKFIKLNMRDRHNKIYVYKFNYVGNLSAVKGTSLQGTNIRVKGAAAGDEICYILKCEPLWENYVRIRDTNHNRDMGMIRRMAKLWTNFAKTGDPTSIQSTETITWPPMTLDADKMLLIGKTINLSNMQSERKIFSFWEEIYNDYYAKDNCIKNDHDEL